MHLNLSEHKDIDALYKSVQAEKPALQYNVEPTYNCCKTPFSGFQFQNFLENKSIEQDKLQNV